MRRIHVELVWLHVPTRRLDGQRRAGRGHVVPGHEPVRVLRVFHHWLPDRAVGDGRRGVPAADQRNGRRPDHVRGSLHHIHRAADVPDAAGTGHQTRHVRRVRVRVHFQHVVFLLLLSGDQGQDVAGDRGVVRQEEKDGESRGQQQHHRQQQQQQQQ